MTEDIPIAKSHANLENISDIKSLMGSNGKIDATSQARIMTCEIMRNMGEVAMKDLF